MKTFFFIFALGILAVSAWGDDLTKAVQQKLKDQGFFYGEATGQPGSETDAAIRRYQIRYGLKVTGALNDETMRSLGLKLADYPPPQNAVRHGNENKPGTPNSTPKPEASAPQALPPRSIASPTPRPRLATPRPTPPTVARPKAEPQTPTYRTPPEEQQGPSEETPENQPPAHRNYGGGRSSGGGGYSNVFAGSVYSRAPGRVQSHVIESIQEQLGRRGFYRGSVDGVPGEETLSAISRFQETIGLSPTGRLDTRTLVALHALPGQEYGPRVRRVYRVYRPYPPYSPYGPYGPGPFGPYGPYGPYGPFARNYW